MKIRNRTGAELIAALGAAACLAGAVPATALAQDEGGLYIAGSGFTFEQAAGRALAQNPKGQRFFVLALPPNVAALTRSAPKSVATIRERVTAAGGVLLLCQRDIDNGSVEASTLAPGAIPVRGFPPAGSNALPPGERYFAGENPDKLPRSNEALRRLRAACS
jgi:hypothetical protein